jgi:hypothetical protein
VEANITGGQGSRRAVAPSDADDEVFFKFLICALYLLPFSCKLLLCSYLTIYHG